jgi:8-oxo-dGTP pyrophosphatase MutT (NUDIX family)
MLQYKKDFFFLPGGSLEKNENIISCLVREFKEETGLEVTIEKFLGCIECHWKDLKTLFQEFNMVFKVEVSDDTLEITQIPSLEKHISFHLVDIKKIYPLILKFYQPALLKFFPFQLTYLVIHLRIKLYSNQTISL